MQKATRSFLPKTILVIALGSITAFTGFNASAVDVVTDPVGFITLVALGTNNPPNTSTPSRPYLTLVGLGMTQVPAVQANITGISGKAITVGNTLTVDQFKPVAAGPNPAYFLEFVDGANPGLLDDISSNNATTIFTATDQSGSPTAGATKYKVYPHWTIGTVFGPKNEAGFLGGSAPGSADNIQVWNPVSQGFSTYYYKTSSLNGTGWRSGASLTTDRSNVVLYVDQGLLIARRISGNVTNKLVGGVKLGTTITDINTNLTFTGNVYPAGITLDKSGLYTTNSTTGLLGGSSPGSSDNVQVWNPSTQGYITYYFKTSSLNGTGWRSGASLTVNTGTNTIPLGSLGLIVRKSTLQPFSWHIPQPFVQ